MRLTFKVEGLSGLAANFYEYNRETQREILDAVREYGQNTREDARGRARVESGKMRRMIEDRYSDRGRVASVGWDEAEFTADGDYPYFYIHELGSSRISPQPMIGPAHQRHGPLLTRRVGQAMREAARRNRR